MKTNGLRVLFPNGFMIAAGVVLALWGFGVYISERVQFFLLDAGLLVASTKPHLFDIPFAESISGVNTGMNARTTGALIGVMFVFGAIGTLFSRIDRSDPDMLEAPKRQPSRAPMDPFGPSMSGGLGSDPFGPSMGGPSPGGFGGADLFGPPAGGSPFPPPPGPPF